MKKYLLLFAVLTLTGCDREKYIYCEYGSGKAYYGVKTYPKDISAEPAPKFDRLCLPVKSKEEKPK